MIIKLIFVAGAIQAILVGTISANASRYQILSAIFGALVSYINFVLLVILWKMFFSTEKKNLAQGIFLIVIKYGILVLAMLVVPRASGIDSLYFSLGIITNPVALIFSGLNHARLFKNKTDEG